jgi:hypothetical protein
MCSALTGRTSGGGHRRPPNADSPGGGEGDCGRGASPEKTREDVGKTMGTSLIVIGGIASVVLRKFAPSAEAELFGSWMKRKGGRASWSLSDRRRRCPLRAKASCHNVAYRG